MAAGIKTAAFRKKPKPQRAKTNDGRPQNGVVFGIGAGRIPGTVIAANALLAVCLGDSREGLNNYYAVEKGDVW
jgi:hypothetical protein